MNQLQKSEINLHGLTNKWFKGPKHEPISGLKFELESSLSAGRIREDESSSGGRGALADDDPGLKPGPPDLPPPGGRLGIVGSSSSAKISYFTLTASKSVWNRRFTSFSTSGASWYWKKKKSTIDRKWENSHLRLFLSKGKEDVNNERCKDLESKIIFHKRSWRILWGYSNTFGEFIDIHKNCSPFHRKK